MGLSGAEVAFGALMGTELVQTDDLDLGEDTLVDLIRSEDGAGTSDSAVQLFSDIRRLITRGGIVTPIVRSELWRRL